MQGEHFSIDARQVELSAFNLPRSRQKAKQIAAGVKHLIPDRLHHADPGAIRDLDRES